MFEQEEPQDVADHQVEVKTHVQERLEVGVAAVGIPHQHQLRELSLRHHIEGSGHLAAQSLAARVVHNHVRFFTRKLVEIIAQKLVDAGFLLLVGSDMPLFLNLFGCLYISGFLD